MKFDQAHRYGQLRQPLYANNRTNCAGIQPVYIRQKRGLIEIHYRLSLRSSPDWSIVIQSGVGSGCGDPLPAHVSPHMAGEFPSCRCMWNDVYTSLMSPHHECLRILYLRISLYAGYTFFVTPPSPLTGLT